LLNGTPVSTPRRLKNGDVIQVGTTVLRFEDPSATLGASAHQPLANLPVWVDAATGAAFAHGRAIELAPKELALLSLLCERAGNICDRSEIALRVWPEYAGRIGDNNIEALVRRLRQKLAEAGAPQDTVMTVKKRGYRLAGIAATLGYTPDQISR
jgi:DNA-binding response OmpR family regulator